MSDKVMEVYPTKTEVVKNCKKLFTPTNIRSFLGLACYYRRFVEGFSSIDTSMIAFTKKKAKF